VTPLYNSYLRNSETARANAIKKRNPENMKRNLRSLVPAENLAPIWAPLMDPNAIGTSKPTSTWPNKKWAADPGNE
jgi:hypothetical protein